MPDLFQQGLVITVLGIALVFAGLGALWGLMELLMRIWPAESEATGDKRVMSGAEAASASAPEPSSADAIQQLTAERARVAAIMTGALLANALPGRFAVQPDGSAENGHEPSAWISTNRSRVLRSWQPPRAPERESLN